MVGLLDVLSFRHYSSAPVVVKADDPCRVCGEVEVRVVAEGHQYSIDSVGYYHS
jgi:hypothetical protein